MKSPCWSWFWGLYCSPSSPRSCWYARVCAGRGLEPHRVLAFGSWLEAGKASAMEQAVENLRSRGEGFALTLTTLHGHPIEVQGRAIGGRAVLRLKDASGVKRDLVELLSRHETLLSEVASLRALIENLPSP